MTQCGWWKLFCYFEVLLHTNHSCAASLFILYQHTFERLKPYTAVSSFISFSMADLNEWMSESQTHKLAASLWCSTRTSTKLHALLNFWPFLTACQQLHETPRFLFWSWAVFLCLCLGVWLHLVWLWAVHLADCYLFCLLMMGACDWWTGSRTSPIDSCW